MDDGMQWLAGTILSAVISSVITVGFLSALVTRLQIRIDHRNNGIKRVYAPGEHSRTLKKQLAEARAIQLLALSGYGFTHAYRRILTDCVARGGTVEYLLAQPGTAYMKDAAEIEGRGADSISEEVGETLKLLEAIRRDAAEKAGKQKAEPGRVLVRYFHTEMREQLILCTDQSGRRTAWLSLLIPPLPALECNMIEYRDAEDCVDYYEAVKRRSEPCPVAVPGRMHGRTETPGAGRSSPGYAAVLDGPALADHLGTESVVKLEILFLGLALGALLLLKQPPLRAGLVAALPVGRTAGLAGQHGTFLRSRIFSARTRPGQDSAVSVVFFPTACHLEMVKRG